MVKKSAILFFLSFLFLSVQPVWGASALDVCSFEGNPYRPGGTCKETVPFIHTRIDEYPITCTAGPEINLPFTSCGQPVTHTCPSGSGQCLTVEGTIDTSQAQIGAFGPDSDTLQTLPSDLITAFYPFSGLADKPLNTVGAPRESFQTFWRLLTLNQQLNAKAKFLQRFREGYLETNLPFKQGPNADFPPIRNSQFPYSSEVANAPTSSNTSGSTSGGGFCVDVYVSQEQSQLFGAQLSARLANPSEKDFWAKYFAGYLKGLGPDVKTHLFENSCNGQPCYQYIINQLKSPLCGDQYLNPGLAIAIALNETGGLASTDPSGANIKHFGCDPFGQAGVGTSITAKFGCMVNTFKKACGQTAAQVLTSYGYASDHNLTTIMSLLNLPAARQCSSTAPSPSPLPGARPTISPESNSRYVAQPPKPQAQPVRGNICGGGQIDMLDYFLPKDASLVNLMANGEQFQTYPTSIGSQPAFVLRKSADPHYFEEFTYDNQYIYHLRDTTWENKCINNGQRAFYSLFSADGQKEGGPYINRCVAPGQSYTVNHVIKSFNRTTCQPCNAGLGVSTPTSSTYTVTLQGDNAYIQTTGGSGAGETKIYTKGKGLTGFVDTGKFAGGNRSTGTTNREPMPLANTCKNLSPSDNPTFTLADLLKDLPTCLKYYPVCDNAVREYMTLDPQVRAKYDALMPFDFDNVRGYLVMRYLNQARQDKTEILGEALPYVLAMNDLLNEKSYGIANFLTPSWLIDKRQQIFTHNDIANPEDNNLFSSLYYQNGIYKPLSMQAKKVWTRDGYTGLYGCQELTQGPSLASPLTYPNSLPGQSGSFKQPVEVPVTVTAKEGKTCPMYNDKGLLIGYGPQYEVSLDNANKTRQEGNPVQDMYGRSVAVFNNPKMWDVSRTLSEPGPNGENLGLVNQLLPAFAQSKTYQPTPIRADKVTIDNNLGAVANAAGGLGSQAKDKKIGRHGGQAEIDLCMLRNFWFLPAGMQKGVPDNCVDPGFFTANATPSANSQ